MTLKLGKTMKSIPMNESNRKYVLSYFDDDGTRMYVCPDTIDCHCSSDDVSKARLFDSYSLAQGYAQSRFMIAYEIQLAN